MEYKFGEDKERDEYLTVFMVVLNNLYYGRTHKDYVEANKGYLKLLDERHKFTNYTNIVSLCTNDILKLLGLLD